jgi:hypothetical protein
MSKHPFMTGSLFLTILCLGVDICNSISNLTCDIGYRRHHSLTFLTVPCLEIDIRNPTQVHLELTYNIGQHRHRALLGNPRWEKRLLKFLEKTTIGKVGPDKIDDEIRRVTRYEEWCNLVEDSESEDDISFLFVCNHIVFSHVVAMTNYLLPSPPMQNTSLMGRIL